MSQGPASHSKLTMFSASSLAVVIMLVLAVVSTPLAAREDPLITLPFTKRVNLTAIMGSSLLQRDQARLQNLRRVGQAKASGVVADSIISVPATNALYDYVVNVGIGTPPTNYTLLVDTGSANTFVGAGRPYVQTSSSAPTGENVTSTYGSGVFIGTEWTDTVTLAPGLVIKNQSIGVADYVSGFSDVDGIIGQVLRNPWLPISLSMTSVFSIGPVNLTIATLSPDVSQEIPTVTDNLFAQRTISQNLVAVSFAPTHSESNQNGELTFGGTDPSKYTGSITYTPITKTVPANIFWGIDQGVRYGSKTTILPQGASGIVDTGTFLTLLASDVYETYVTATGAVYDDITGLLRVTPAQFKQLQSLYFTISGKSFELTPNAQIFPRNLNSVIGGDRNGIYLIIGESGLPSGEGLDFVIGQTFLERYYTIYDMGNKRFGLAATPFTYAIWN
ncbi:hypothetical protein EIP91_005446 [Steccherinum ochraceum]|uniref:Peptidase A1 domain-containing protein n=1 Tax=Steccherinum ochraceum TaxID=92696 RepID=A0A4R0RRY5_9APHY|nr:hypothetical protein EIP91_005446 [Steccherinum ochraceum]